ncbi:uncharacterized protein LOC107304870 [Oryza brachyantha]|uniref:uncharacterized protein LOC107304870 n=1 Tax=Oryza brachyantha TaxID=4533 RepID=UPI001ADA113B|nr:uncharacterized protein LOC107304870 [Oryza brachyantha]
MPWPGRGQWRINVAMNRLSEYGFPRPLIRQTIENLLMVYGSGGWVFLENSSYRVIIEKLLEEDQTQQRQPEEDDEHGGGATSGEPVPENGIQTSGAEVPASGSDPAKAVAVPSDATTAVSVLPVPEARVHTGSRSYGGEIADENMIIWCWSMCKAANYGGWHCWTVSSELQLSSLMTLNDDVVSS